MSTKPIKKLTVWILTGRSESGDDFGPLSFHNKPNTRMLTQIAHDWDGSPEMEGPGDYGSYVFLTLTEAEIK